MNNELEQVLQDLGLVTPTRGRVSSRAGRDTGRDAPVMDDPVPKIIGMGGGFGRQFTTGIASPVSLLRRKMTQEEDDRLTPHSTGEHVGRFLGELVGWGGIAALTAATFGKGTVALAGAMGVKTAIAGTGKATLAATVLKTGVTGAAVSAGVSWDQDLPPGEIAKQAGYGAVISMAFPVAGHLTKGVRADIMNKMRLLRAAPEMQEAVSPRALAQRAAGLSDDVAAPLWKQVEGRVSKTATGKLTSGELFNSLKPQEKISVAMRAMADDPAARKALQPAVRELTNSAWRTKQFTLTGTGWGDVGEAMTEGGTYLHRGGEQAAKRLGDTKGISGLHSILHKAGIKVSNPEMLEKGTMQYQINYLDTNIRRSLEFRAKHLKKHGVSSGMDLQGTALNEWKTNVLKTEAIMDARTRVVSAAEPFLGRAQSATINSALAAELKKHGDDAMKGWGTVVDLEDGLQVVRLNYDLLPESVLKRFPNMVKDFPLMPMASVMDDVLTSKPVTLWERMLTPTRGVFGEATTRVWRNATNASRNYQEGWGKEITEALKPFIARTPFGNKAKYEARELITRWLWAKDKNKFVNDAGSLWTKQVDTSAKKVQSIFKRIAKTLDIPEEAMLENYAPHLKRPGEWVLRQQKDAVDPLLKFFAQEKRTGLLSPRETDILYLLNTYVKTGARKKFLDPAFRATDKFWDPEKFTVRVRQEMKELARHHGKGKSFKAQVQSLRKKPEIMKRYETLSAELKEANKAQKAAKAALKRGETPLHDPGRVKLYESIQKSMLGMPTDTERVIDNTLGSVAKTLFGMDKDHRYTQMITSFLVELQYNATLGWNLFSPIKNMTQQILPIAHLDDNPMVGLKYWMKAYKSLASAKGRELNRTTNLVMNNRTSSQALAHYDGTIKSIPGVKSFTEAGFAGFKAADRLNVATSHMMKMLYEMDKNPGKTMSSIVEEAYSFTMSTQFMYGLDSPLLYKGALGRLVGTLMSWPMNYAHLLKEQGTQGAWQKAASTITLGVMGAEALSATGLSFLSVNPMQTASGLLPVAMLEGQDRWPLALRGAAASANLVRAMAEGDPAARDWAFEDFKRAALHTTVPFSTQYRRIADAYDVVKNDFKKYDAQGRLRYESDLGQVIKGVVGPTMEGRKRWEELTLVSQQISSYQRVRKQAMNAFFQEDYEEFFKKMDELVMFYGKGIEAHEIRREADLREMTALERRATGIPSALRDPLLDTLQSHRTGLQEVL